MTVQITIEVPDELEKELKALKERLPEILEHGLRELRFEQDTAIQDETTIVELLASQPTPEQILSIQPSATFQKRTNDPLQKNRTEGLSSREEAELERHLTLEHLVRLAKAHAVKRQSK